MEEKILSEAKCPPVLGLRSLKINPRAGGADIFSFLSMDS
jgi:hypothetical protein